MRRASFGSVRMKSHGTTKCEQRRGIAELLFPPIADMRFASMLLSLRRYG